VLARIWSLIRKGDDAELEGLRALLEKYDEFMSAYELPNIPDRVAANDNEGAKN
jgi:hypothetical protein